MTDPILPVPGEGQPPEPEERLPARRPPSEPAPVDRFAAPASAHQLALTPERAAGIVRQSGSARWVGFLAVLIVVLFVIVYYFYELGVPGLAGSSRLTQEEQAQSVQRVERGYNLFEANCARCHGDNGQGGIGPILNDQMKLATHLTSAYINNVLTAGGRYVCGNPDSLMPVWASSNGGPLNYIQIEDLIEFIRAPNDQTYEVRDPGTNEPVESGGKVQTFTGWRDPNYVVARHRNAGAGLLELDADAGAGCERLGGSPAASGSARGQRLPGSLGRDRWGRAQPAGRERELRRPEPRGARRQAVPDRLRQPGPGDPPQHPDRRRDRASSCSRETRSTGPTRSPTTSRRSRPAPTSSAASGIRT